MDSFHVLEMPFVGTNKVISTQSTTLAIANMISESTVSKDWCISTVITLTPESTADQAYTIGESTLTFAH